MSRFQNTPRYSNHNNQRPQYRNGQQPSQQREDTKRRKKSPEYEFYKRLTGNKVLIERMRDGSYLTATLLWVDRFTVGLRDQETGREFSMNKGAIETMSLCEAVGKRHERGGNAAG